MSQIAYSLDESGFQFLNPGEVLGPVDTHFFLQLLTNAVGKAQLRLRTRRSQEVDAEAAYHRAKAPLMDREDCPEVGTRAGQVSQKARDAWFADHLPEEYLALRRATAARQAAWDFMDALKAQMEVMRSLNKTALTIETISTRGGGA